MWIFTLLIWKIYLERSLIITENLLNRFFYMKIRGIGNSLLINENTEQPLYSGHMLIPTSSNPDAQKLQV